MKDKRLTFRRRHSYNTKSNKTRVVKTPGGRYHSSGLCFVRTAHVGNLLTPMHFESHAIHLFWNSFPCNSKVCQRRSTALCSPSRWFA